MTTPNSKDSMSILVDSCAWAVCAGLFMVVFAYLSPLILDTPRRFHGPFLALVLGAETFVVVLFLALLLQVHSSFSIPARFRWVSIPIAALVVLIPASLLPPLGSFTVEVARAALPFL